ncbi:MAG: hypothetical protein M9894_38025, partial [Planctomycetes bacterium]|nr:hypothetical protein [Planctomycetota bacterium]
MNPLAYRTAARRAAWRRRAPRRLDDYHAAVAARGPSWIAETSDLAAVRAAQRSHRRVVLAFALIGPFALLLGLFKLALAAGALPSGVVLAALYPLAALACGLAVHLLDRPDPEGRFAARLARREPLLRELIERLDRGALRRSRHHVAVAGHYRGQPVGVRVWNDPTAAPPEDVLVCHVAFDTPLRCRLERRWTASDRRGGPSPDEEGWLWLDGEVVPEALQGDLEARRRLLQLFDEGRVLRLEFDQDGLSAEVPASAATLDPVRLRDLLLRLIRFKGLVSTPDSAVPITLSPRSAAESCPYCRDEIHPGSRAQCRACRTPHHDACLDEAGCTVLGCRGARPRGERARAPA